MRKTPLGLKIFLAVVVVVVAVTAGVGILVGGPPGSQRSAGIDDGRISDLRSIHTAINSYWTGNGELPEETQCEDEAASATPLASMTTWSVCAMV